MNYETRNKLQAAWNNKLSKDTYKTDYGVIVSLNVLDEEWAEAEFTDNTVWTIALSYIRITEPKAQPIPVRRVNVCLAGWYFQVFDADTGEFISHASNMQADKMVNYLNKLNYQVLNKESIRDDLAENLKY